VTKSTWEGYWRPSGDPRAALPLGGRSVGHGRLCPGWQHGCGTITWTNLYWGIRGRGGPAVNGEQTEVLAEHIWVHEPGSRISGYPIPEAWEYRWITVDGPQARAILETLGLMGPWPRRVGPCPEHLFVQLETEIRDLSPIGEYRASATAYAILMQAAGGASAAPAPDREAQLVEACRAAIERRFSDPALCVDLLARDLGVHRSRLARLFRERLGIPPSIYIQRLRLREALALLRQTDRPIRAIARAVGFVDPGYFSRNIRKATGMSPRRLRASP